MHRYLFSSVKVFLFVTVLNTATVTGLKWVPMKVGDPLPNNVVYIDETLRNCVGRSRSAGHKFVPTEVTETGEATLKKHDDDIYVQKIRSEVLTTSELDKCEWKPYYYSNHYDDIEQNIVRVGLDDSHIDSIFVGRSYVRDESKHITSILLPRTKVTKRWMDVHSSDHPYEQWQYLFCDTNTVWMDVSLPIIKIHAGSVSAGLSIDGDEMFVARSKSNGIYLTGYVIPSKNAAFFYDLSPRRSYFEYDEYDGSNEVNKTKSAGEYQVLIGEENEYEWVDIEDGIIPDYALPIGTRELEIVYVAQIERTVRSITQSEALERKSGFQILIKNEV